METVEATQLSSNIRELEDRRDQCLLDIGHRVMAMYESPVFEKEALRDRVEEVRNLNAELETARQELEDLKASLKSSVEELIPGRSREEAPQASDPSPAPQPPDYE
jgi:predicted nuclease with TOPRIM domain